MVWLRCVGSRSSSSSAWELAFARLDFAKPGALTAPDSCEFATLIAVVEQLSIPEALGRLRTALGGGALVCALRSFTMPVGQAQQWNVERVSSSNDYCPWPAMAGYRALSHASGSLSQGPFVDRSGTFYEMPHELIIDHSGVAGLDIDNQRMRSILVCLWDYRGRFESLTIEDGALRVGIAGDLQQPGCRVVGRFVGETYAKFSEEPGVPIPVLTGSNRVELMLLSPDGKLLDRRKASILQRSRPEELESLLAQGEGSRVEFKPWVNLGDDPTVVKLARAALGMANLTGGVVLVGVSDDCTPQPVGELRRVHEKLAEPLGRGGQIALQAVEAYGRQLRDRIQRKVHKSLEISLHVFEHDAGWVLALEVAEGDDKPCMTQDGDLWIRAGASTRRARPEEAEGLWRR